MKCRFTLALWLLLSAPLLAQNNQINWSRNQSLHDGSGTDGLKLSAAGLYFNLIEVAPMLVEHQEFVGRASNIGSFTISAENPYTGHATNVASAGAATGVVTEAKGIAFAATIRNYSDAAYLNALRDIANPFPLTNLSQRLVANSSTTANIENGASNASFRFGSYDQTSNEVDDIAYRNLFCLQVVAAGNFGKTDNPKPNSLPLTFEYDKLPGRAQTAKNTLAVGSVYDMALTGQNQIAYAYIDATSSSGPTDDLRVKPELVAPGNSLTLATKIGQISDRYYKSYISTASGTSVSSPIVTGTALLLQELFAARNKQYMRAATVKGLLMHTADKIYPADGGNSNTINWGISTFEGPDPFCGYGLINATAAAQAIITRSRGSIIDEKVLLSGRTHVVDIPTKAGQTVTVSICWMDPARYNLNAPFTVTENDQAPTLVNDLGVVVVERPKNGTSVTRTLYPYSFVQQSRRIYAVNDRPNRVDPYEKIKFIPLPDHIYSITIYPESIAFWGGSQQYSLIVTGLGLDGENVCQESKVIREPIDVGVNEEATNQITLGAEIKPEAGLAGFNAPNLVLVDGALIQNSDAVLFSATCSRSGLRQAANEPAGPTAVSHLLEELGVADVQLYPNPVGEYGLLKSKEAITSLWVYSQTGKLMWQQASDASNDVRVNTASLPPGQYIIVVEDALGVKKTKKMTKF